MKQRCYLPPVPQRFLTCALAVAASPNEGLPLLPPQRSIYKERSLRGLLRRVTFPVRPVLVGGWQNTAAFQSKAAAIPRSRSYPSLQQYPAQSCRALVHRACRSGSTPSPASLDRTPPAAAKNAPPIPAGPRRTSKTSVRAPHSPRAHCWSLSKPPGIAPKSAGSLPAYFAPCPPPVPPSGRTHMSPAAPDQTRTPAGRRDTDARPPFSPPAASPESARKPNSSERDSRPARNTSRGGPLRTRPPGSPASGVRLFACDGSALLAPSRVASSRRCLSPAANEFSRCLPAISTISAALTPADVAWDQPSAVSNKAES